MTYLQKYENPDHFTAMLRRVGVTRACIIQMVRDDFDTMQTLVQQYKRDVSSFETYLKTLNKSMNTGPNPVRFSPIVSDRLVSIPHYFIQTVTCFHAIPDMAQIDRDLSSELIEIYRTYKKFNTEEPDDEILITLPELKGHDNWKFMFLCKIIENASQFL